MRRDACYGGGLVTGWPQGPPVTFYNFVLHLLALFLVIDNGLPSRSFIILKLQRIKTHRQLAGIVEFATR